MRALPVQQFFILAAAACGGAGGARDVVASVDVPPAAAPTRPSPRPAPPPPRPPAAACLPPALAAFGALDVAVATDDGAVRFCLGAPSGERWCASARDGAFEPEEPGPAPWRRDDPAPEVLPNLGRWRASRTCVAAGLCKLTLEDRGRTVHRPELFARTTTPFVQVAGDRFALLDVAGVLHFLSSDTLQPDGDLPVPAATQGALVSARPGVAWIVGGAPFAGTVSRIDLLAASVTGSWTPPRCP